MELFVCLFELIMVKEFAQSLSLTEFEQEGHTEL